MIEAMKQALEALNEYVDVVVSVNDPNDWRTVADGGKPARDAITSLRQAIAELESQEPVAWIVDYEGDKQLSWYHPKNSPSAPLFAHPPQRTWQGLTDEEIYTESRSHEKWAKDGSEWFSRGSFARAIEAKLKERNI